MGCGKQSASEYKRYSTLVQPLLDIFGQVDVSTLVDPNPCLHHTVQCRGKHTKFPGKPGGNLVARVSLYSGNRGTLTCKCRDWRLFRARKI